jgi:hypothetical protein
MGVYADISQELARRDMENRFREAVRTGYVGNNFNDVIVPAATPRAHGGRGFHAAAPERHPGCGGRRVMRPPLWISGLWRMPELRNCGLMRPKSGLAVRVQGA